MLLADLSTLKNWRRYGKGWSNHVDDVRDLAARMALEVAPMVKSAQPTASSSTTILIVTAALAATLLTVKG